MIYNPKMPLQEFLDEINKLSTKVDEHITDNTDIKEKINFIIQDIIPRYVDRPALFSNIETMQKADDLVKGEYCLIFDSNKKSISLYFVDSISEEEYIKLKDTALGAYLIYSLDDNMKNVIVNDLKTGGVDKALSAEQGKVLKGLIDGVSSSAVTKLSELVNDTNFKSEQEILTMINNSNKLKKEVIDTLPTTGKEDIIYLVKDTNGKGDNNYLEYLWINGKYELIGSTQVDLTDYAKISQIPTKISELAEDSSHRTITDTEKNKLANIQSGAQKNTVTSVNSKTGAVMIDFFIGDDTRAVDYPPSAYLSGGERFKANTNSQFEFKTTSVIGVKSIITDSYCILNTITPWKDVSGGYPMQVAYGKGLVVVRVGISSTNWSAWQKVSTSPNDYTNEAKAKVDAIPSSPKYTDTITTINGKTGAITKADIVALGIPSSNSTYSVATASSDGLMSKTDKTKLDGLQQVTKQTIKDFGFPEHVVMTEAQYNALSSTQQNAPDIFYYIKA